MTRWLKKEWILLSCLIAVGLLSFAGIHWTHEKDHRPTTKSAILSLPSNATNRRNTVQSSTIVSPVHTDTIPLRISTSNRLDIQEHVDTPISNAIHSAQGTTTHSLESKQPNKFSPTPAIPLSVATTTVIPPAESIMPTDEKNAKSVFSGNIFMDFYESDEMFVYAHYKSIESLLYNYPSAEVFTLIVGPRQLDYYKLGDNLSKHQFQKYRKRGYKVRRG